MAPSLTEAMLTPNLHVDHRPPSLCGCQPSFCQIALTFLLVIVLTLVEAPAWREAFQLQNSGRGTPLNQRTSCPANLGRPHVWDPLTLSVSPHLILNNLSLLIFVPTQNSRRDLLLNQKTRWLSEFQPPTQAASLCTTTEHSWEKTREERETMEQNTHHPSQT